MDDAGYARDAYTLVAQTYSSPIPDGSGFRYRESGYTRQTIGGCGVWNRDANWANATMVATLNGVIRDAASERGMPVLEAESALAGHRLCENTVGLLEEQGIANWTSPGAADRTEWVSQIRTVRRSCRRISSRRTCTRATGARRRCATACARPTTAACRLPGHAPAQAG